MLNVLICKSIHSSGCTDAQMHSKIVRKCRRPGESRGKSGGGILRICLIFSKLEVKNTYVGRLY